MPDRLRATAAWRIAIWPTLAFAGGTALAFSIVYILVAQAIHMRSDAWLQGEAELLSQVAENTPQDRLYPRIVREVAELATRELPDERNAQGQKLNYVFFLADDPANPAGPLWVGPGASDAFIAAIRRGKPAPGAPQSVSVNGWPAPFRVVARREGDSTIYLGLSGLGDAYLLQQLTRRFLLLWGGTVLLGFLISYSSARRTLRRVESITETAARIGSEALGERVPESSQSDEISRLAQTFNHMLDRIQSSVDELRTVTDTVAHDLKSPVTSIRGTLESTLSGRPGEAWRDSVAEAIEGLDRLLLLLNTILDLAEAQAGALRLDRRPVDLSSVIRKLVDLYQPAMVDRHHDLIADVEPKVFVDADQSLLNRVMSNLIENELVHLPAGCCVRIRLRSQEGAAELVIEDNGPGFPPEILSRACERFVRGEHSSGHGLGLAFVNAVVQSHGGSLRLAGRPEGGTLITVSLPAGRLQAV
jgi:signal transduction histidine kinase